MNRRIVLPSRVVSLFCLIFLIPTFAASSHAEQTDALVLGLGKTWETPIYVNDSGSSGPTVIVTGGVHGNEPAGASAAEQIRHWPIRSGKLIVIPRLNAVSYTHLRAHET